MMNVFNISTINRNGRAVVVVTGEVDLTVGEPFRAALTAAQNDSTDVIVDLTGVTFIDSTAINALIRARMAVPDGGRLRVVGARHSVRRVFEITGVCDLLLYPATDTDHALDN